MTRTRKALVALIAIVALLGACGPGEPASKADIKEPPQEGKSLPSDYSVRVPDRLTVYQNLDGHPTIVRLCIGGLGFVTTTRRYSAYERIPEWDSSCADAEPSGDELSGRGDVNLGGDAGDDGGE